MKRIHRSGIEVDQRVRSGEQLPFEDNRFDCVVSTFALRSVAYVGRVVREAFRVLKPGGKFLFLEHGLSPDPNIQKWQHRLNQLQMWIGNGCHLDRNMTVLISCVPFASVDLEEFYLEKTPRTHGNLYRGSACK